MKTIEPVSIWDNGLVRDAKIFDAYASLVSLGTSATFYYALFSESETGAIGYQLATGSLTMSGEAYKKWTIDSYAWDWIAEQLNLTITGEYVPPVPPEPTPTPEAPIEPSIESPAV
jgi:hypothetical protein